MHFVPKVSVDGDPLHQKRQSGILPSVGDVIRHNLNGERDGPDSSGGRRRKPVGQGLVKPSDRRGNRISIEDDLVLSPAQVCPSLDLDHPSRLRER
jgi:hypothetical protein